MYIAVNEPNAAGTYPTGPVSAFLSEAELFKGFFVCLVKMFVVVYRAVCDPDTASIALYGAGTLHVCFL